MMILRLLTFACVLIVITLFMNCDKETQLNFKPYPSPSFPFGACGRGECKSPFCAENCETADKCHVRDVNGICRPSCGYAAHLLGYGGYGADNKRDTSDDCHIYKIASSCAGLSVTYPDGVVREDWIQKDFHLDVTPYEVVESDGDGVCCVRECS